VRERKRTRKREMRTIIKQIDNTALAIIIISRVLIAMET